MSTQTKQTETDDPSELTDDELLERIAASDTPLASVAARALEVDQEEDLE